jgi:hypothetical protein
MIFKPHLDLSGVHAFLSASKHSWTNYDEDKLADAFAKHMAAQKGNELHEFAKECIRLKQRLPGGTVKSLNNYINDAIGFRMTPEQGLYYSNNAFGTADAISFSKDRLLRIHDLKTGVAPVSMRQLEVYAALFCLEYKKDPTKIKIELRVYQSEEVIIYKPEGRVIRELMDKIVFFDEQIDKIKADMEE